MSYANLKSKIIITANGVQADDGANAVATAKLGFNYC